MFQNTFERLSRTYKFCFMFMLYLSVFTFFLFLSLLMLNYLEFSFKKQWLSGQTQLFVCMSNQMVTSEIREWFHACFVQILIFSFASSAIIP